MAESRKRTAYTDIAAANLLRFDLRLLIDWCSAYAIVTFFLNCHVASIFAYKLLQMKSPFRRSTKIVYRILIYSLCSNASIGVFALWFAVSWHTGRKYWFQLPLELLGRSYPVVMVLALLAREDARNTNCSRVSCSGVSSSPYQLVGTELDFVDPAYLQQIRRSSGEILEPDKPPEEVAKFLVYRSNAKRGISI